MNKKRAALLLALSFVLLLGGISLTKAWLIENNINMPKLCASNPSEADGPKRVCSNGTCILYSDWIKMQEKPKQL